MFVFTHTHNGVITFLAGFRFWSDACEFKTKNFHREHQMLDLPDLEAVVLALMGKPVDEPPSRGPCQTNSQP